MNVYSTVRRLQRDGLVVVAIILTQTETISQAYND